MKNRNTLPTGFQYYFWYFKKIYFASRNPYFYGIYLNTKWQLYSYTILFPLGSHLELVK